MSSSFFSRTLDRSDMGLLISRALSIPVIGGSCLGKLPQVAAVYQARSAEGISKISIWTETAPRLGTN